MWRRAPGLLLALFCGLALAAPNPSVDLEQRNATLDQLGRAMSPGSANTSASARAEDKLRTFQFEQQLRRQGLADPRRTQPHQRAPQPLPAPRRRRERQLNRHFQDFGF